MDLLDALCSNTTAQSVVELSLNPAFRRSYNSVYDGIQHIPSNTETTVGEDISQEQQLIRLISAYLPSPQQRKFWLFGVDVTPAPRHFAHTLEDRGYVSMLLLATSQSP